MPKLSLASLLWAWALRRRISCSHSVLGHVLVTYTPLFVLWLRCAHLSDHHPPTGLPHDDWWVLSGLCTVSVQGNLNYRSSWRHTAQWSSDQLPWLEGGCWSLFLEKSMPGIDFFNDRCWLVYQSFPNWSSSPSICFKKSGLLCMIWQLMIWIFCSITASLRPGLAYPLGTRTGSLSIATWARSLETIKQYSTHRYLVISRGASLLPPVHEVSGVNEVKAALKLFSDGGKGQPFGILLVQSPPCEPFPLECHLHVRQPLIHLCECCDSWGELLKVCQWDGEWGLSWLLASFFFLFS